MGSQTEQFYNNDYSIQSIPVNAQDINNEINEVSEKKIQVTPTSDFSWSKTEIFIYIIITTILYGGAYIHCVLKSLQHVNSIAGLMPSPYIKSWYYDNSDGQWRGFRSNIPALLGVVIVHISLQKFFGIFCTQQESMQYTSFAKNECSNPCCDSPVLKGNHHTPPLSKQRVISPSCSPVTTTDSTWISTSSSSSSAVTHNETSPCTDISIHEEDDEEEHEKEESKKEEFKLGIITPPPPPPKVKDVKSFVMCNGIENSSCSPYLSSLSSPFNIKKNSRIFLNLLFAFIFVICLHGPETILLLSCLGINFLVLYFGINNNFYFKGRFFLLKTYTWIYCLTLLLISTFARDFKLSDIPWLHIDYLFLNNFPRLYSWTTPLNFISLRIVSFNYDYLWVQQKRCMATTYMPTTTVSTPSPIKKHHHHSSNRNVKSASPTYHLVPQSNTKEASLNIITSTYNKHSEVTETCNWSTTTFHQNCLYYFKTMYFYAVQIHNDLSYYNQYQNTDFPLKHYNFSYYIAYILYPPLYLCGPIASYNAWIYQMKFPQKYISWISIMFYGIRWCILYCLMEFVTHTSYATTLLTLPENIKLWSHFSLGDIGIFSLFGLLHIYLKLLLIWRFFRFWALCDGVSTPENMIRCVFNNYSMEMFWKCWHRSFNRWIIRYIYIPLSGSKGPKWRQLFNVVLVFGFVAIWHDIRLKLFTWGLLICGVFCLEIMLVSIFQRPSLTSFRRTKMFRSLCLIALSINAFFMACANSVGFGFGLPGLKYFIHRAYSLEGLKFICAALTFLFFSQNVTLWTTTL